MSIPFLVEEKTLLYRLARPESGREGSLGRRSLRIRASGAVGLRWQQF
jgi:hypothetical protein